MKKVVKSIFWLIFIACIVILVYIFLIQPQARYQSIYLVPENAAFIIESDKPFKAWDNIIHSKAWERLRTNAFLAKLDTNIRSLDSLISSKRLLFKLLGSRKILLSAHSLNGRYDFLYVIDLKKFSKFRDINKYLQKALGNDFRLTQRKYKELEIFELYDKESREMYYFSMVKNQLIFSKNYILVEASIDQMDELIIGRDLNYIEVSKKISGRGLFRIYINYKYFDDYIRNLLGKTNEFLSSLTGSLYYSGISFDIDEDALIKLTGFTTVNDTVSSYFLAILNSGKGSQNILDVIPGRTASYICLGFNDVIDFYENLEKSMGKEFREDYQKAVVKIEKRLKINMQENFFRWIDNEIALVQTQPSNLGKENEFAVVFKAKNKSIAAKNLDYITERIRKNSPVRFKEIDYNGYKVSYLHIPGFFKIILGKLLSKLEKPYFTIIDKYVIFSNHPQTLKSIIDDYKSGNTLANSVEFYNFSKNFSKKSSVFLYIQTPLLLSNLKEFVGSETWLNLQKNKAYIVSFPQIGFQVNNADDLFKLDFAAQYYEQVEEFKPAYYDLETIPEEEADTGKSIQKFEPADMVRESEIVIDDLDAKKHEEYYDNGQLKLSVGLKNGLKHGNLREFYEDGTLKIKGRYKENRKAGLWSYYNEQGILVEEREFKEGNEINK
jgi:hypothetical protein